MKRWDKIATIAGGVLFAAYLVCMVFFIVYKAQWTYGDDHQFLVSTAIGEPIPSWIGTQPAIGRFWPLGQVDYDLLLWVPAEYKCIAHFILSAISMVCLSLLIFGGIMAALKDYKMPVRVWTGVLTAVMVGMTVYYVFLYLVFAERIMTVLIAAFFVLLMMLRRTNQWGYALGALLCAAYLVFCKEILFGSLAVLAGFMLIMDRSASTIQKITWYGLLVLAGIYIGIYMIYIYPQIEHIYNDERPKAEVFTIIWDLMGRMKIWYAVVVVTLVRCFALIVRKDRNHLLYDAFLLAGLVYMAGMAALRFPFDYYYYPALTFVAVPTAYYLVYYGKAWGGIILLSAACYFAYQPLPNVIRDQITHRTVTYPMMERYYDLHKAGYSLVWEEKNLTGWDLTLWSYHRFIHMQWINYLYGLSGTAISFEFAQTPPTDGTPWVRFSFERDDNIPIEQQVQVTIMP